MQAGMTREQRPDILTAMDRPVVHHDNDVTG